MKFIRFSVLALLVIPAFADEVLESNCAAANGITPICGFLPPEDLHLLADGKAIIVGGFNLDNANGDIRVLHLADNSIERIYEPDGIGANTPAGDEELWGDPECPGPPTGFAAHGIYVAPNDAGDNVLLVVNHTSREAIEWLEVKDEGSSYSARWRGCVIVPEDLWINDIAMLPGGGFVATHMMPREISRTIFDRAPNDKVASGYVVEWQPQTGWKKIEGTEGALPNGIEVSPDGNTVYSNHYFANEVVAFERSSGKRLWTAPVNGGPDNTSTTSTGKLLIPTHLTDLRTIRDECLGKDVPYCEAEFALSYIEPATGEVTEIFRSKGAPFGGATIAVEHEGFIYMGSFAGDRIGRIPVPQ